MPVCSDGIVLRLSSKVKLKFQRFLLLTDDYVVDVLYVDAPPPKVLGRLNV